MAHSKVAVLLMVVAGVAGCSETRRRAGPRPNRPVSSTDAAIGSQTDASTSSTTDAGEGCFPNVFTGFVCSAEAQGLACPGAVQCTCGTQATQCVCQETEGLGFIFVCEDECDCSRPDAGPGSDAGTGPRVDSGVESLGCTEICAPLVARTDCGGILDQATCESACAEFFPPGCDEEQQILFRCLADAPVVCNPETELPTSSGCNAEFSAYQACSGG